MSEYSALCQFLGFEPNYCIPTVQLPTATDGRIESNSQNIKKSSIRLGSESKDVVVHSIEISLGELSCLQN
jgi:hypothetical protein